MHEFRILLLVSLCLGLPLQWAFGQDLGRPSDTGDEIPTVDAPARSVVDGVRSYYRGLQTLACTAEVSVKLETRGLDELVYVQATAQRPNRVSIFANERHGLFPTNQFVSNGRVLFEESTKRLMHMLSPAPSDFDALYARVAARSAPNMPVEVFLSLLTSNPIENMLHLDVEPGLIRLVGEEEVNGVLCQVLSVNENGSKVWISKENPPWIMRYRNSPIVAKARYLPPGAMVIGPVITIDFKTWTTPPAGKEKWNWVVPDPSVQYATIHESAKGGPEDGYTSMLLSENETPESRQTGFQPVGGGKADEDAPLGLALGTSVPDVDLTALDGNATTLQAVLDGKPAAIVFWVPGTKFSNTSVPRLLAAMAPLQHDGLKLVSIGSGESLEKIRGAVERSDALAGSYADTTGLGARSFNLAGVFAVILVDSSGKVHRQLIGARSRIEQRVVPACERMMAAEKEQDEPTEQDEEPGS